MQASPTRAEASGPALSSFPHHYIIVRDDLPRGFLAAQIVHATGDSLDGRHPPGTFAIVLAARDEAHLAQLADRLEAAGVALVRVTEPDPPWNGALTAIGLRPVSSKEELRRHLSSLPRLR